MSAARGIAPSYEPNSEMSIHADETLLQRLTMNLLDNTIKYLHACQRERQRALRPRRPRRFSHRAR
jgi:signal transduction histidine kinase